MANKGWIPEGSEIQEQEDIITITPPDTYIYVGYDMDEQFVQTDPSQRAIADISCTCNTTGTCNPFKATAGGHTFTGCEGTCTNCTMKQSLTDLQIDILQGGYINPSIEVSIIQTGEILPGPFEAMYESEIVLNKIQAFLDELYQGEPIPDYIEGENQVEAPENHVIAFVNVCGRATPLLIPARAMPDGGAGGDAASCSCTRGSCILEKKSLPLVGSVIYCSGSCTGTCTLHTKLASDITFEAETFDF